MEFINNISQAIKNQTQSKNKWATHLVIAMSFVVIATGYLVYNTIQTKTVNAQSPRGININSPGSGTVWRIGDTQTIEWTCGIAPDPNFFKLYYSEDTGVTWNSIINPDTGNDHVPYINSPQGFDWEIPVVENYGNAEFRIKVEAWRDGPERVIATSLGEEIQVTEDDWNHFGNCIDGDNIAWTDIRRDPIFGVLRDIYSLNLADNPPTEILISAGKNCAEHSPDIYGDRIVWVSDRDAVGGYAGDIYMYDPNNTPKETKVTPDELDDLDQFNPLIYGDYIVYGSVEYPVGGVDGTYLYTISTGHNVEILEDIYLRGNMTIDGLQIFYKEIDNSIHVYNIDSGLTQQIVANSDKFRDSINADNGRVVWTEEVGSVGNQDIYIYDPTHGIVQITTNLSVQAYPWISGNVVTWLDSRHETATDKDIYYADISDLNNIIETRVTLDDALSTTALVTSNNRILWSSKKVLGDDLNLYVYEISEPELFIIDYGPVDEFVVEAPDQANSNQLFALTVTALDQYGNTVLDFQSPPDLGDPVTITTDHGAITPNWIGDGTCGTWIDGVITYNGYVINSTDTAEYIITAGYHGTTGSDIIEIIGAGQGIAVRFLSPIEGDEWYFGENKPIEISGSIVGYGNGPFPVNFLACLNNAELDDWYSEGGTWDYRQQVSVNHTEVEDDQVNFPVAIIVTSNDLRDIANGGHVGIANGDDILFTNSSGIKLNHEIESYDPATGELVAWVNVDILSSTVNTELYMYYGNSTAVNQENVAATWSNDYRLVYHLQDSTTPTTTIKDSVGTSDGTKTAIDEPVEITGKLGKAQDYDGDNDYIDTNDVYNYSGNGAFSVFQWTKGTSNGNKYLISQTHATPYSSDWILGYADGGLWFRNETINGNNIISDGNWHYHGFVFDGTTAQLYIDGVSYGSAVTPTGYEGINSVKLMARGDAIGQYAGNQDEVSFSTVARNESWIKTSYNSQNQDPLFPFLSFENEEDRTSGRCLDPKITSGDIDINGLGDFIYQTTWDNVGYLDGNKITEDMVDNVFITATIDIGIFVPSVHQSGIFSITEAEIKVASIVLEVDERTAVNMPFTITASVYDASDNPINNFNEVLSFVVVGPGSGVLNPGDIGNGSTSGSWSGGSVTYNGYTISATGTYALRVEYNGITASDTIIVDENAVYIDNPTASTTWYEGGDGDIIFRAGGTIPIDHFKIFYSEAEDGNGDKIWVELDSNEPYINYLQTYTWFDIDIPGGVPQDDIAVKVESYDGAGSLITTGVSEDFSVYAAGEKYGTYTSKVIPIDEDNPDVYITGFTEFNAVIGYEGGTPTVPDDAMIEIFIKIADKDGIALYPGDGWYELGDYQSGIDLNGIFTAYIEDIREIQFKIYMWSSEIADYQPWVSELKLEYDAETLEDKNIGLLSFVGVSHKSVEREGSVDYEIVCTPSVDYKDELLTVQLVLDLPGDPVGINITASPDILIVFDGSGSYSRTITLLTDETAEIANDIPFTIGAIVLEDSSLIVNNGVLLYGWLDITDSGADDDFLIAISGANDKEVMPGGTISFNVLISFVGDFDEAVTLSSNIESVFGAGVIESVEFLPSAIVTPLDNEVREMRITIEDDSGEHAKTEFNITGTPEQAASKTISPKPSLTISDTALEDLNIEVVAEVEGGISSDKQYPKFSFRLYQEDITNPSSWAVDINNLVADSTDDDEVTINIEVSPNDVVDGETYVGYLRSTRHLWRKATTPTGGKITIDLSDLDYNLKFPTLLAGDVAPIDRDNIVNVLDFPEFIVTDWHQVIKGLLADFDNNNMINALDIMFMFENWFVSGELPGS